MQKLLDDLTHNYPAQIYVNWKLPKSNAVLKEAMKDWFMGCLVMEVTPERDRGKGEGGGHSHYTAY